MTAGGAKTRTDRQRAKREPASQKKGRPKPDLTILQTQVFRGPNYWSYEPCIRMLVDLGSLEEWPSNTIPGFNEHLLELLPGVGEHSCSLGKRGGFKERLVDGTWLGHVAEHVALELQRESGAHISRGKTRSAGASGQYNVIYGYAEEYVGRRGRSSGRPNGQQPGEAGAGVRFRRGAGAVDPAGGTAAVRTVDAGDPRRGREPRHPVHPPERAVARAARAGEVPATDPGDHDLADERARRRHRERQEDDEPAARRPRGCRCRRARSCGTRTMPSRRPGGSGSRSSRSRWTATTAAASGWTSARSAPFARASNER